MSQYNDGYVLSNTWATFEAQFMKKFSNTEADLKKSVAYKSVCDRFFIWLYKAIIIDIFNIV